MSSCHLLPFSPFSLPGPPRGRNAVRSDRNPRPGAGFNGPAAGVGTCVARFRRPRYIGVCLPPCRVPPRPRVYRRNPARVAQDPPSANKVSRMSPAKDVVTWKDDPAHFRTPGRREFLRVGVVGALGLTLGDYLKLSAR